jgi:hypothetical protein
MGRLGARQVKQFLTVAGEGQIEAGGEDAFKRAAHEGVAFADDKAGRVHGVLCLWLGVSCSVKSVERARRQILRSLIEVYLFLVKESVAEL